MLNKISIVDVKMNPMCD